MIKPGLYEALITESIEANLEEIANYPALNLLRDKLRSAEAGDRLALHLARFIENVVDTLPDGRRVEVGLQLARQIVDLVAEEVNKQELRDERPVLTDSVLTAILNRLPDGTSERFAHPLIPLLDTTLLTNAPGEPRVGHQLQTEIESATQIDVVMAFIRSSGIRPFVKAFRKHCNAGKRLRVLTTTYTNSTEQEALEQLEQLGAEVRVSYDISSTRLHAKAWLFHRNGGMSTAYIGSSNLTHQAQRTGLEWNVRVSGARNASVIEKIEAVFDSYWEGGDFEVFDTEIFAERVRPGTDTTQSLLSAVEIRLYPFQERMLEQIAVARSRGKHKNLLVAATGTGKTVMAAVDYARLHREMPYTRLLFVAHTIDILKQSLATFRHALRDGDFGELWVGGAKPRTWDHVFASIQSITASGLDHLAPDHFDVVTIDEVHHGAANSYKRLLDHVRPKELLGLTATPERADGLPILNWFGGRISAELRLWDAIDQHRLVPFDYFGVHDGSDLSRIKWVRGRGYDAQELTNLYTADDVWARLVIRQLEQRVQNLSKMKALGFCVSIAHARFTARVFNQHGIKAVAVWGDSPKEERERALRQLNLGEVNILFSVDIFNEGVDVPNVDTLLLLRPTDSPVLFLQQLGRGLRKAEDKSACLVLDFVGQHRKEFQYHRKFQALLGGSRKHVEQQVQTNFPFLPAGCHMELEQQARDVILKSIKNAIPSTWPKKVDELRDLSKEGVSSISDFLERSGLELQDIYQAGHSWSELKEDAGLYVAPPGASNDALRRACGRMLHVDDESRLLGYQDILSRDVAPVYDDLNALEARYARMLVASVCGQICDKGSTLNDGLAALSQHSQIRDELVELFDYLLTQIDHQHMQMPYRPDVPLNIHARYTRIEILAALDVRDSVQVPTWREGVRWLPQANADVFAFTLDKTSGQFSPTTRYRDYAMSRSLIHWESQSTTSAESETGRRYRNHLQLGTEVYLFARERADDRAFWFLGPANFVSYRGEKPMAITWELVEPLPGDLYASFAAAVT